MKILEDFSLEEAIDEIMIKRTRLTLNRSLQLSILLPQKGEPVTITTHFGLLSTDISLKYLRHSAVPVAQVRCSPQLFDGRTMDTIIVPDPSNDIILQVVYPGRGRDLPWAIVSSGR